MAVSIAPPVAAMAPCAACAESYIPPAASRCNGARPEHKKPEHKKSPALAGDLMISFAGAQLIYSALARLFNLNFSQAG